MANSQVKPGTNYARLGSFKATATEALSAGDIVWVAGRDGKRKRVSKASAVSNGVGARAALFVAVGDATAEGLVLVSPCALVTKQNVVTRELETIAALSGGSLGDPVYLSNTAGEIALSGGTVPRIIGHYVDDYSWEFAPIAGV